MNHSLRRRSKRFSAVSTHVEPKIVLLVRLLNAIDEGRCSFEELKDRIVDEGARPSTRSLRRYLSDLESAGFPWYFDRTQNVYRFSEGYSLKRLDLNTRELFGLVALRSLGASIGGTIGGYVDEVTSKMIGSSARAVGDRVAAGAPLAFRVGEVRFDERAEQMFNVLTSGERSNRSVTLSYQDKFGQATQRTVDPYGFIVSGGRVYVVGYDHLRKDKRVFAIDNITEATLGAKTFIKPGDFDLDAFAAHSISGVLYGELQTDVVVRFERPIAKAAMAARVVAERNIVTHDDGSVSITYRVSDVEELLRWTFSWGAQAEVIGPPEIRTRSAALLKSMIDRYSNENGLSHRKAPVFSSTPEGSK